MRRRGFTLLELQVSMLLTLTTMAALFLFTFYFWQNHHQRAAMLQFHRQADVFFEWHHQKMRQCMALTESQNTVTLVGLDGDNEVLQLTEKGPTLGAVQFFEEPVRFEADYSVEGATRSVRLEVSHTILDITRTWECSYPVLPNLQLGKWQ